jgi:hypothetical protein
VVQINVDNNIRAKLHDFKVPLEVWDEHGHLLGRIVPVSQEPANKEPAEEVERKDQSEHE